MAGHELLMAHKIKPRALFISRTHTSRRVARGANTAEGSGMRAITESADCAFCIYINVLLKENENRRSAFARAAAISWI